MELIELVELGEAAVAGLVGWKRILLEPAVATEFVEVVAWVDGFVDECGVKDAQFRRGLSSGGSGDGLTDEMRSENGESQRYG